MESRTSPYRDEERHRQTPEARKSHREVKTMREADPRRWQALALVCAAFFMTVLDVSIVTVALPSVAKSLHFTATGLQWVITAYAITFGGFLLLGGRTADLLGRRLIFMMGLALFSVTSLTCGLATSTGMLIGSRVVQGLGAAMISPATLSIITTTFEEGAERNKALGIWGAMGGAGAAAGVLFGGILTKYLGWGWIFFVNVPVGAFVLTATPFRVRESRAPLVTRSFDFVGAATVTGGLALLVYAISEAPTQGWGSGRTIGELVGSLVILGAFVAWEARTEAPLMPLGIFKIRTLAGANAVAVLLGGVIFANFFLLTLYVQDVLRYSALRTGLTFLATAGTTVVVAGIAQALTTRVGARTVMTVGLLLLTGGMLFYAQIPVHGHFASNLLPGYLLVGFGLATAFVAVSIAALAGVGPQEAGLASGLINTSQQIGGALGVAVAGSIAATHAKSLLHSGHAAPVALTSGYSLGFWVTAGFAAAGVIVALLAMGSEAAPEPQPVLATYPLDKGTARDPSASFAAGD
jgi:EmrB/QacA subfamily drug resistance transporter